MRAVQTQNTKPIRALAAAATVRKPAFVKSVWFTIRSLFRRGIQKRSSLFIGSLPIRAEQAGARNDRPCEIPFRSRSPQMSR